MTTYRDKFPLRFSVEGTEEGPKSEDIDDGLAKPNFVKAIARRTSLVNIHWVFDLASFHKS